MSIVRQSLTQGQTDTAGAGDPNITTSVTVDAGSDLLLIVVVGQEAEAAGTPQVGSVTFGGVGLTQLAEAGTTWSHAEIWYLKDPSPSTANVVTTWTPAGDDFGKHGIYVFEGVDQTTTFRTAQTNSGSGTSSSRTVPDVVTDDYVLDVISLDGSGHNAVAGADQTEEYDTTVAGCETASSTQAGASGGVMSWTWTTSCDFSHVATALISSFVSQAIRPDADVTTTGWTTTPLWSKIEEESADGTVITATAS